MRSTQNKLDLETNKTMNLFFEKIYRALVFLFGCIQILTILGFDVNALIAGAGVVGIAVSLGAQSTLSNLIARGGAGDRAALRHRGLDRAGQL